MKTVVIFGIFDGVHEGHRNFFAQAREFGDELVVIVGRDKIAEQWKNKTPRYSEHERLKLVQAEPLIDRAVLGDTELSMYSVLVRCKPDSICLGYDQTALEADLKTWLSRNTKSIELHMLKPYKPKTHHNSLM
jgi:FAD synthetase